MLLYLNVARIQVGVKVEHEYQKILEDLGKTQGNTRCVGINQTRLTRVLRYQYISHLASAVLAPCKQVKKQYYTMLQVSYCDYVILPNSIELPMLKN